MILTYLVNFTGPPGQSAFFYLSAAWLNMTNSVTAIDNNQFRTALPQSGDKGLEQEGK